MKSRKVQLALLAMVIFYTGCKPEAEKIIVGKDQCAECKMTVMDERFGGEIVSKKGKVFKFDDVHCMGQFMKKRSVEMKDIYQTLVVDYAGSHEFIKVNSAHFVVGSKLKSPMGSNAAAFANEQEAKQMAESIDGKFTNWATLYNVLVK